MTRFLASVTNVGEALIAVEGGADIIDLKNPAQGALGALPLPVIEEIVHAVAGRRPVSATIGDLPMQPELVAGMVRRTADTGVDIVKIGLFGTEGHAACIRALGPVAASGVRIVAVLFADGHPDFSLLPLMASSGFHGAMLDTASKNGRRLRQCLAPGELQDFIGATRSLDMLSGLAGSLAVDDIAPLAGLNPDYLGFRGALCVEEERKSALDPYRLQRVRQVLQEYNTTLLETV